MTGTVMDTMIGKLMRRNFNLFDAMARNNLD